MEKTTTMEKLNRRSFLKRLGLVSAAVAVAPAVILKEEEKPVVEETPAAPPEGDLWYYHKHEMEAQRDFYEALDRNTSIYALDSKRAETWKRTGSLNPKIGWVNINS